MSADPASLAALAPVVRAFVQRHHIPTDSVRADGRVVLTIDQRYRVHLMPAPHNRAALQSELLPLPEQAERRTDDLLLRLTKTAAGLLQRHPSTLAIDNKRQALVLQQTVAAGADLQALQDALADFANALAFWSRLCRKEAAASRGVAAA
jgi:hypothetical protein